MISPALLINLFKMLVLEVSVLLEHVDIARVANGHALSLGPPAAKECLADSLDQFWGCHEHGTDEAENEADELDVGGHLGCSDGFKNSQEQRA